MPITYSRLVRRLRPALLRALPSRRAIAAGFLVAQATTSSAFAQTTMQPIVVADIAPIASLVATVAGDHARVLQMLPAGASPHEFAFRPSQAQALAEAELIIWIGSDLTPWLADPIENLAQAAAKLELANLEVNADADDHAHAKHELEAAEQNQSGHDNTGDGHADAHLWLDPAAAAAWVRAIEDALSERNPDLAAHYQRNSETLRNDLGLLTAEIRNALADLSEASTPAPLIAHDSMGHFERAFGLPRSATIIDANARSARPAALRSALREVGSGAYSCLMADPETPAKLISALTRDHALKVIRIDPLGGANTPGPALYFYMMRSLARAYRACAEQ